MTPSPALAAFLSLIGWSEGSSYDTIVTGINGPATFTDFSDHPFAPQFNRPPVIVRRQPLLESTDGGCYWMPYSFVIGVDPVNGSFVSDAWINHTGPIWA